MFFVNINNKEKKFTLLKLIKFFRALGVGFFVIGFVKKTDSHK
jgi:hypothetical protein